MTNYIYKLENPINHKVYIGCSTNPVKRANHGKGYVSNKELYQDILQLGFQSFNPKVLLEVKDTKLAGLIEQSLWESYKKGGYEIYNKKMTSNITHDKKHNTKHSKPVLQYDSLGNLIQEWPSAAEADRKLGINYSLISLVASGKRSLAGGFIWKFKENN